MKAAANGIVAGWRTPAHIWAVVLFALFAVSSSPAQQALSEPTDPPGKSVWERGVGEGFQCGAQSLTLSAGGACGVSIFGGQDRHDMALGSLTYGIMLDNTVNQGHWYRGNLELRAELFGGKQFSPRSDWLIGFTPHLRYDFATGTRWIPYIDGGAGVSATSIREPDLGGAFQFNLQAALGVERFLTDDLALTLQAGYLHVSSAEIYKPNHGVNCITGMLGVSFFF